MTAKISEIFFRSILSLFLILLTAFLVGMVMQPREIGQRGEETVPLVSVEVVPLEDHQGGLDFKVDGEVIPFRSLNIVPEVAGRVVYKSDQCRLGRSVKAGEVLFRIDPTDFRLEVDRLKEAVAQAESSVAENVVQLENTKKELAIAREQLAIRERELQRYQNAKLPGVYSSSEMDTVQTSLLNSRDTIQKLENQGRVYETQATRLESVLKKERVNLAQAELDLARTEVRSPISGVVKTVDFETNSYLQKGESVAAIQDTTILEIQCNLYMKQVQWILRSKTDNNAPEAGEDDYFSGYRFPLTPVTILYELEGDVWEWTGTLKSLGGAGMDSATRMVPCRVTVDAPRAVRRGLQGNDHSISLPPPTLLSGMYVTITVHANPDIPLYRIPEKALLPGNRIWTATDGKLRQHSIRVATNTPEGVLFYADSTELRPVDLVVVSPLATPVEGGRVQITNPDTAAAGLSVVQR